MSHIIQSFQLDITIIMLIHQPVHYLKLVSCEVCKKNTEMIPVDKLQALYLQRKFLTDRTGNDIQNDMQLSILDLNFTKALTESEERNRTSSRSTRRKMGKV